MQPIGIIVKDRDILGGNPVFQGTPIPFQALVDYLESGQTLDAGFPGQVRQTVPEAGIAARKTSA